MAIGKSAPLTMRFKGVAFVVLATVFWSSSGIFISFIMDGSDLSAVGLAFWRDLATFVVLLAGIGVIRPQRLRVKKNDLVWLAAMGASIGIFHILWNNAVVMIGASLSTVIQCNAPIFVTIMARFIFQEIITTRKLIAAALAIAGTILVAGLGSGGEWKIVPIGLLIALASAIMYGAFSLFGKKLSGDYNPWTILLYAFGFGTITLFLFQLGTPAPWPTSAAIVPWFVGLVLISTIAGFTSYTAGLQNLPASTASIAAMIEILFASVMAYIFLGERLDFWQIVGSVLIVGGVVLVSLDKNNRKNKEKHHA
ncbi:MAG: DMT family transporter [Chloroflexota bacterium]|nr:DMT family transporter [Chloroflexota bacterium]